LIRRREGPSQKVPIVAMTANAFPEDIAACQAAGMTDFVAKPVSKERLVEALLRALPEVAAATAEAAAADVVPVEAAAGGLA
jgi:CheY-like chemotaxis protein